MIRKNYIQILKPIKNKKFFLKKIQRRDKGFEGAVERFLSVSAT